MKIIKVVLLIVLTQIIINAQDKPKVDPAEFNAEKDSLMSLKSQLLSEKTALKIEIDSLYSKSEKMDEELKTALYDFFIKKYGEEIGKRVYHGQVWKGMTEKMMLDGWGKPDKKETNKEKWGVFTQLYYGDITYFFKNGELIDWEETK